MNKSPNSGRIKVGLKNRDHLELIWNTPQEVLTEIQGLGCHEFLKLLSQWRTHLQKPLNQIPLPSGEDHGSMLLREALLRAQGKWHPPYQEEELCHCRAVPYKEVDAAIVAGCHSVEAVALETSAGTACGTCRDDTFKTIEFRKKPA